MATGTGRATVAARVQATWWVLAFLALTRQLMARWEDQAEEQPEATAHRTQATAATATVVRAWAGRAVRVAWLV